MVDRATNIRVRIDIKDAMGKITQMKQGMNSLGAAGSQAGTQVQQGMNKATGAINNAGNAAVKNAVNFQTMGQGMLNLSTAGVQTYTSISNLARAENRAEAASLGLQRAQDLLARKTLAYNKMVEAGLGNSREAKLLLNEMETATNDLAVKQDKLKIEQEAVTDVYMLFFANLANVGVSSLMIYKTMMEGVTKAQVINKAATIGNTVATKLNTLAKWNSSKSLIANAVANNTATAGLVKSTLAVKAATVATKALNFALGPVGLVIMGISAALMAYETNFLGFKDGVNSFLGIQEEFNEGIDDGTEGIEAQTQALTANKDAFEKLVPAMQNYILMQEKIAKETGDPRELLRLAELRAKGYSGQATGIGTSGFSTGGGTTQGVAVNGKSTAFQSANTNKEKAWWEFDFFPSAHGEVQQTPEQKVQTQKPALALDVSKNPFGSQEQRIAFLELPYPQQRDVLLSWIDNTWHMPGTQQAYVDKYWEIFEISNGFTERTVTKVDPQKEMQALIRGGKLGTFKPQFAPGYAQAPSIFDFDLDNREMVQSALGVDIGAIANTITSSEAIRIGSIQKSLGKFNAQPSKWVTEMRTFVTGKAVAPGAGIMALLEGSGVQTGTMDFEIRKLNQNLATGGRTAELLREIRAFGGINAAGQTSATEMFQLQRVYNPRTGRYESPIRASDEFYERLREQDAYVNSGAARLNKSVMQIFEGQVSGMRFGYRTFGYSGPFSQMRATTGRIAHEFGADIQALEEMEGIASLLQGEHGKTSVRALMHAIRAGEIADRRIDRVEDLLAAQLGINFNANSKAGYFYESGRASKNRRFQGFVSTAQPMWEQIREDIGAGEHITLPSIKRMEAIANAFAEYGSSFTNFNNVNLTGLSQQKLGLTEQKVFDIRFEQTRGDRELLNRLRYVEKIEASSSGTSPL